MLIVVNAAMEWGALLDAMDQAHDNESRQREVLMKLHWARLTVRVFHLLSTIERKRFCRLSGVEVSRKRMQKKRLSEMIRASLLPAFVGQGLYATARQSLRRLDRGERPLMDFRVKRVGDLGKRGLNE